MKQAILAEPVLVGRELELEELKGFLDSAAQGRGTTVFVSGEAGSGKTRLTREFIEAAKKTGASVLAGWCLSDVAVPYFPFAEAFDAYFSSANEEESTYSPQLRNSGALSNDDLAGIKGLGITAWLAGLGPEEKLGTPKVLSPQVWKDQLFVAVAKTLHSISVQQPIILFIEDIHWADSASLALLHYISRVISSEKILVLATFRSEELTSDAEGHSHPLAESMRTMRREDLFTEIELPNLNKDSVSKIVQNMIGGSVQQELVEKLAKESRGNALFIVESLRMLFERKSLVQENNQWRLAVYELGIPSKVKDIILRRLAILKNEQRRVLDAASVIGEKFDVELLGAVLGQDSLEVLENLNVIARSTSLVRVEGSFYKFDHARSREALYDEIPLPLRNGYHRRVAERMESINGNGRLPLSDLTYHYAQAGFKEKAAKYAMAAGENALARWSNEEAIKHFTCVLGNVPENPENAEAKRRAQEGLGDAYYASSMFKQAAKTFEDLSESETGAAKLRALRKAMESTFQYQDVPHLMELVKKAEPYAAADRLESARVLTNRGRVDITQSVKLALEDMAAALRVFEEEYSLRDAGLALLASGLFRVRLGEPQKGIAESLRSIALFAELGDFRFQMEAYYVAGMAFDSCLLDNEALGMYAKVIEIDENTKMSDYTRLVYAITRLSKACERTGDWEEALSNSLRALELAKKTDSLVASASVYSNLTREYVRLGDLKHAEDCFEKLMKLPPELLLHHPYIQGMLAEAVFFAGKGQWKESNEFFKEELESFKTSQPSPGWELFTKLYFAWALERQGRVEEAKMHLEEIQKTRREAEERFAHVSLLASLMVRREVTVGDEFEMRLDIVNVSRKPGLLIKIEDIISLNGFKVAELPTGYSLQNGSINTKNRGIGAFQVETVKLTLQAIKAGSHTLNPKVFYIDELGETKTSQLNPATITVKPTQPTVHIIPGRISIGFPDLDDLLGGGIPENYAMVLASVSSDERTLLIKRFLEAGTAADETTFYLTAEPNNGKALAERYPSNFYLFICNPQASTAIQSLPNVTRLKGVENLTEIDIALTKAFRTLNPSAASPKRACIEIISDVLLQHHAVITRKWLSEILPDLKARGFTTLAVVDPQMHPPEELQAILGLFEGEIRVYERETANGAEKVLRIRKLDNQKYMKNELTLTTEKFQKTE